MSAIAISVSGVVVLAIGEAATRWAHVAAQVDPPPEISFQSYAEAYSPDFEDIRCRVPDLSRLRATIDYRPRYDLDAIVRELVALRRAPAGPS